VRSLGERGGVEVGWEELTVVKGVEVRCGGGVELKCEEFR